MKKQILGIELIILAFSMLTIISAQQQYNCPMGGGMMYGISGGYGSGMMLFSWITYILLILLIIAGIYWLIKSANRKR